MDQLSVSRHLDRIRELQESWLAAARHRDLDGMMIVYAPDAQELMPGQPAVVGRDALRELYRQLIAKFPRFNHALAMDEITIAESGDLAVLRGSYRFTFDEHAPERVDIGKLVSVWVYLAGDWRIQLVIANSDIPPEPPK
jgi:uncharacterized protein (TIGR02246 family)